jgi:hypothetical protein
MAGGLGAAPDNCSRADYPARAIGSVFLQAYIPEHTKPAGWIGRPLAIGAVMRLINVKKKSAYVNVFADGPEGGLKPPWIPRTKIAARGAPVGPDDPCGWRCRTWSSMWCQCRLIDG